MPGPSSVSISLRRQFPAFHFIQFLHHLHIPGAGQQRSDWYLRGSGAHVHPDAGGTVCRGRHGDPEMIGQSFGNTAEGRGTSRRHPGAAHAFPSGHGRQILVGQLGHKGFQGSPSRLHIREADSLIAVLRKGRGKIFPDPVSQGRGSCRHLLPTESGGCRPDFPLPVSSGENFPPGPTPPSAAPSPSAAPPRILPVRPPAPQTAAARWFPPRSGRFPASST